MIQMKVNGASQWSRDTPEKRLRGCLQRRLGIRAAIFHTSL